MPKILKRKENWQIDKCWIEKMYWTPDEMKEKISQYFNWWCRTKKFIIRKWKEQEEIEMPVPTITWLALFLWFESRQSFYDYEKKPTYTYIIKRARTFIEMEYEEMLRANPTWAIFALKNFWWTDRQEIENTNTNLNYDVEVEWLETKSTKDIEEMRRRLLWK